MRSVTAKISRKALRHNLEQIRRLAPGAKVMAMVKANAYGHHLVEVAKTLNDSTDAFGVASIGEALRLREAGITADIVLLEGIFQADELPLVQAHNLTLVVHHIDQVHALQEYQGPCLHPFAIWIKINTGMNRLGFERDAFEAAFDALKALSQVTCIGFMTHFSSADETGGDETRAQIRRFHDWIGERPGKKCLANSAGIVSFPDAHADWVRPGLILYGASPFQGSIGSALNLMPAMSLHSRLIAIRTVGEREKIGYAGIWENPRKISKIGVVGIGYGDGYPWHAKNNTPVLVNGVRVPLVGRVSMDMLTVDLTDIMHANIGDPVTLWGEGLAVEEVAQHAGTIPYELFCRFTERVTISVQE